MAFSPASTSRDALQRLLDGLQTLIREHLALARFELKEDVRDMGRDLLVGASGVPALAASNTLGYIDSYRSEFLPANLLQAQRDYFGAHTYKRIDKEGTFHTEWAKQ